MATPTDSPIQLGAAPVRNTLYYGDNLYILRQHSGWILSIAHV